MNDASMPHASVTSLEHASFPHLSPIEWEALHRLAAVSGDSVVTTLLTAGTEGQQHLAAQDCDGEGRLHLKRWFCEVDIAIEARQLSTELARTRFLLSKLTGKAKDWALGKLVIDASCFPTMDSMKQDLRLAFEPPQDETAQRTAFLSLREGTMSMLEYIQHARHLVSCITSHPVDMTTPVHVFVSGMNAGYQRFYLTRKTPSTHEEAFTVALREDYSVMASQAFDALRPTSTAASSPEPMEIDAIQHFG
ncbi:Putative Polyprotein, partial [Phytophthora palmivora]